MIDREQERQWLAQRPRHQCPALAAWQGQDEDRMIVFDPDGWCLADEGYDGFDVPIAFCPFCGVKLEAP